MMKFAIAFSPFGSAGIEVTVAAHLGTRLSALGDAARPDHLDVIVHQGARAARIAKFDQVGKLGMNFKDVPR
jgi:hypothetical protein